MLLRLVLDEAGAGQPRPRPLQRQRPVRAAAGAARRPGRGRGGEPPGGEGRRGEPPTQPPAAVTRCGCIAARVEDALAPAAPGAVRCRRARSAEARLPRCGDRRGLPARARRIVYVSCNPERLAIEARGSNAAAIGSRTCRASTCSPTPTTSKRWRCSNQLEDRHGTEHTRRRPVRHPRSSCCAPAPPRRSRCCSSAATIASPSWPARSCSPAGAWTRPIASGAPRRGVSGRAARFDDLTRGGRMALSRRGGARAAWKRPVSVDVDDLIPIAHWVTPEIEIRRYDTRFFLTLMPAGPGGASRRRRNDGDRVADADRRTGARPARGDHAAAADVDDVAPARAPPHAAGRSSGRESTRVVRIQPSFLKTRRRSVLTLPGDPSFPTIEGWDVPEETRFVLEEGRGWLPVPVLIARSTS